MPPPAELDAHGTSEPPPISGTMGVRSRARDVVPATPDGGANGAGAASPPPSLAVVSSVADVAPAASAAATPMPVSRLPAELEATDSLPDPASRTVARKPLLASEALMEDLAPVEPARAGVRTWCAGVGGASLLFGALPLVGALPGGTQAAIPWMVTGAIAVVVAVLPVTYRLRAVAMVVLGLLSGVVALQGAGGALMQADGGGGWALARLLAAVALPAALLFRSRYRAYAGARIFLGSALFLSVPFAVHTVLSLFGPGGLATVGAVLALFALAGSFAGFMGSETTGAGAYMAPTMVVVLALELLLRGLDQGPLLGVATGSIAFGGGSALASLGLFQILAWRFAADARRIDLHSGPRESRPPHSDREPASDWSTRE